jgi:hypothetical protein
MEENRDIQGRVVSKHFTGGFDGDSTREFARHRVRIWRRQPNNIDSFHLAAAIRPDAA